MDGSATNRTQGLAWMWRSVGNARPRGSFPWLPPLNAYRHKMNAGGEILIVWLRPRVSMLLSPPEVLHDKSISAAFSGAGGLGDDGQQRGAWDDGGTGAGIDSQSR